MRYSVGEEITFKKQHACGSFNWKVDKVGAVIKLECIGCNRVISLLPSEVDRRKKQMK